MPVGDAIFQRLRGSTGAERSALADVFKVRLTGDKEVDVQALSKEYRWAAGNSFGNLFRDAHELEYRTILDECVPEAVSEVDWRSVGLTNTPLKTPRSCFPSTIDSEMPRSNRASPAKCPNQAAALAVGAQR